MLLTSLDQLFLTIKTLLQQQNNYNHNYTMGTLNFMHTHTVRNWSRGN